jgi:hypothetical protein
MLTEKANKLVSKANSLVSSQEDYLRGRLAATRMLDDLDFEDILMLQAIMYIGQQERKPDPDMFRNYYAYESELERYRPERLLEDYMKIVEANRESSLGRLQSMLEKRPLKEYLENGFKLLRIDQEVKKAN